MPYPAITTTDKDNNLCVIPRGPGFGANGAYSIGMTSGAIVATGAVDAAIFSFRWSDLTGKIAIIEDVRINAFVASTITTSVPYDLALYVARSFTADYTTSISAATMTTNNAKRRTSMATSLVGTGINIVTGVAAGMTGMTHTLDAQPVARVGGMTGTVVGTQFFGTGFSYLWGAVGGQTPIVLSSNEGIVIRAPLAGPATGTFKVSVNMDWVETADY
jgi:hypothetical protein